MKSAVVLAGGLPQIELIQELKKRGYKTILIDYLERPLAMSYADKFYRESTLDVDAVRKIVIKEKASMIITCCTDQALATVSLLSEELSLPCYISAEIGSKVTNKEYMKKVFFEHDIPTAKYLIIDNLQKLDALIERVYDMYPLIVKPVDCNSSKGVMKVNNKIELVNGVKQALKFSRSKKAIIEEYIDGEEISVDAFISDGICKILSTSFTKKIKDDNKFVIYKGEYPAKISKDVYSKIEKIAQKIATAFDLNNAPFLLQMLVKDEDVHVIEFSARTGGCVKNRMIKYASGVDVIKATVDLFELKRTSINPCFYSGCIVDEFIYCSEGTLDYIEGVDFCIEQGWLREAYQLKNKGDNFIGVNSSGDRAAALVYVNATYEEYIAAHNNVISKIKVYDNNGNDIMRHDLLPKL